MCIRDRVLWDSRCRSYCKRKRGALAPLFLLSNPSIHSVIMAFECRLLGVVRLSIIGRFVFLESAIFRRFVWDFSEIWICGLYIVPNDIGRKNCDVPRSIQIQYSGMPAFGNTWDLDEWRTSWCENGICLGRLAARSLDERFLYGISGIDLLGRDI